jgi:hypothetical protein
VIEQELEEKKFSFTKLKTLLVFLLCLVFMFAGVTFIFTGKLKASVNNNGSCLSCHSNAGRLMGLVKSKEAAEAGCAAPPAKRPPFLDFFVKAEFADSLHGRIGCKQCHGGNPEAEDRDQAHKDMKNPEENCASCHQDIVRRQATSIHATLAGQDYLLKQRTGKENFDKLVRAREADCKRCHCGCGDCHISIPKAVGGGLLSGHKLFKTPPMVDTCAVCHGTRAGGEYLGKISEDLEPDVHKKAGMHCIDCHKEDMHGDGIKYASRWEVKGLPECINCHQKIPNFKSPAHNIAEHQSVSCKSCHAQAYKNCFQCHASFDETGNYHRKQKEKAVIFKIDKNTVPGYIYKYTPVRHKPVTRDTFGYFGENIFAHFDQYPTWATAAPHNIKRITSRNKSCNNCHCNKKGFLLKEDLTENDSKADDKVILEGVPRCN